MARKYNWQVSPEYGVCEICQINDNIESIHPCEDFNIRFLTSFKCCHKCGFSIIDTFKKKGLKQIKISWSKFNLSNWNYDKNGNRKGEE